MKGTLRDPAFQGTFEIAQGKYSGTMVPDLSGRFGYADRQLVAHFDALHGGTTLATVDAQLPIDLAFTGRHRRSAATPSHVDRRRGDSLPIELIPQFTDLVSDVHGHAGGRRRDSRARSRIRPWPDPRTRPCRRHAQRHRRNDRQDLAGADPSGERHGVRRLAGRHGEGSSGTAWLARHGQLARAVVRPAPRVEGRGPVAQRLTRTSASMQGSR